ncbi:MAG: hypothetical protein ACLSIT_07515 [Christensenellales bacterium]
MFRRFFLCAKDAQTAAEADRDAAQAALTAKENELANVQNTLAATENVLALTQDALGTNESLITIIKESLVAKDGVAANAVAAQEAAEAELAATKDTQAALDSTRTVLADTNLTLSATVDELTAAKAALAEKDAELAAKKPMLFLHLLSTDAATLTGTDTTALDAENYLIVTVGEQTCAPIPMPEEGSYFCLIHGINMNLFHITADGIELVNASADHNCLALGEITMTIVSRDALKQE